jgi:hypothetical protein
VSTLESLAHKRFGELSLAEIRLLESAGNGSLAICGSSNDRNDPANDPGEVEKWGKDRSIRGALIGWLCVDRIAKSLVHPGGVQILGARIIGPVELLSASIEFPLVFACCELADEINLMSGRTRTLSFTQTHMQSIFADGAVIAGAFFLRESRAALLQFPGARIEGQFGCEGSRFNQLILEGSVVGVGVLLRKAKGQIKLSRARIATDIDCEGGTFAAPLGYSGHGFDAGGASVEGSVLLRNGSFGSVQLLGAHIGSNLDCTGTEFIGPNEALAADAVVVKGTVFLSTGFHARGAVHFTSCQITGDLNCEHSAFETGLTIERADIRGTFFWRAVTLAENAELDVLNTSVGSLSDDRESWPSRGHLQLHGFFYKQISLFSPKDAEARLDWLDRQKSYARQPYRQLASVMKDEGNDEDARKVLYKMECLVESQENPSALGRLWRSTLNGVTGYGYYPLRALRWFVALVLLGFLFFGCGFYAGSMVPTDKEAYVSFTRQHSLPGHYARFHAFIYSVENSFPLVKLGQVDLWQPDPSSHAIDTSCDATSADTFHRLLAPKVLLWFRWGQILAGWILATVWIAGLSRLIRRD